MLTITITFVVTLAAMLAGIPGVVEHGLFVGLVQTAYIADSGGVREIEKSRTV